MKPLAAFALTVFLFTVCFSARAQTPPGASVSVKVSVPPPLRSAPFNVDRYLTVPPRFSVSVYARVPNARFLCALPNGDLLVSRPGAGAVEIVRPGVNGGAATWSHWATGLKLPHDVVLHVIGGVQYVYVSESNQINRYVYKTGDLTAQGRQIVVRGLPDASSPELNGSYGHQLKNLALDSNHELYVAVASATNASPSDTLSDPVRCAVYQYDANGTNRRFFARGLRNAEGLAFVPGTNELWAVVNNRDNIRYPYNDATGWYGQIVPDYVDNHPPDEFIHVRDGGNYGWPFANPNPNTARGMDDMPFDPDYENNRDWSLFPAAAFDLVTKGIQAHSAPLGLTFLLNTNFPAPYKQGAVVGLHGSWNRQRRTGYKVAFFPWNAQTQRPGAQMDLVTGWVNDATQSVWGRPVDAAIDAAGNLLVSDDDSGTIYKVTYTPAVAVSALSLYPASIYGGNYTTGDVTLTAPAPPGGLLIDIGNSNRAAVWTPTRTFVPAGATRASFGVGSFPVAALTTVMLSTTAGGQTRTAQLTVAPASLRALAVSPATIRGGGSVTATVTLTSPAPAGGLKVYVTTNVAQALVPPTVTVPAGATSRTFIVTTRPVAATVTATVKVSLPGVSRYAVLTVTP